MTSANRSVVRIPVSALDSYCLLCFVPVFVLINSKIISRYCYTTTVNIETLDYQHTKPILKQNLEDVKYIFY